MVRGKRQSRPFHGKRLTLAPTKLPDASKRFIRTREAEVYGTAAAQIAAGLGAVPGTDQSLSNIVVPIIGSDQVLGIVAMEDYEREGAYGDAELRLLQTVAGSLGVALENVRLFNETQQALSRQTATADILRVISASPTDTQPVFDAIVATAVTLLGCDRAAFSRVVGSTYVPCAIATPAGSENDRWTEPVTIDATANFPSQAIVAKATVHIPDWDAIELPPRQKMIRDQTGARASLAIPLLRDSDALGVLILFRNRAGGFDAKEIALAESFRDQAVIAIENVRLFNETKEALEQQTATAEILRVISGSINDTQPVFDAIVQSCQRLLGGKAVALAMVAGYTGTNERATYTCIGDTVNLASRLEAHTKIAGRAILIDSATHADVGGIDADPLGAVEIRGKSQPVDVFAVAAPEQQD